MKHNKEILVTLKDMLAVIAELLSEIFPHTCLYRTVILIHRFCMSMHCPL